MGAIGHRKGNKYIIDGDVVKGYTSNNNVEFIFDLEDFDKVKEYTWRCTPKGYIESSVQIKYEDKKQYCKCIPIGRFIMDLNSDDKRVVDHKDMNPKNNCKSNLRVCTRQQNNCNTKSEADSVHSKYKGVTIHNASGLYQVRVVKNKKVMYNGYFKDELEAAKAYNEAALKYHGDFARLNIIEGEYDE